MTDVQAYTREELPTRDVFGAVLYTALNAEWPESEIDGAAARKEVFDMFDRLLATAKQGVRDLDCFDYDAPKRAARSVRPEPSEAVTSRLTPDEAEYLWQAQFPLPANETEFQIAKAVARKLDLWRTPAGRVRSSEDEK